MSTMEALGIGTALTTVSSLLLKFMFATMTEEDVGLTWFCAAFFFVVLIIGIGVTGTAIWSIICRVTDAIADFFAIEVVIDDRIDNTAVNSDCRK